MNTDNFVKAEHASNVNCLGETCNHQTSLTIDFFMKLSRTSDMSVTVKKCFTLSYRPSHYRDVRKIMKVNIAKLTLFYILSLIKFFIVKIAYLCVSLYCVLTGC